MNNDFINSYAPFPTFPRVGTPQFMKSSVEYTDDYSTAEWLARLTAYMNKLIEAQNKLVEELKNLDLEDVPDIKIEVTNVTNEITNIYQIIQELEEHAIRGVKKNDEIIQPDENDIVNISVPEFLTITSDSNSQLLDISNATIRMSQEINSLTLRCKSKEFYDTTATDFNVSFAVKNNNLNCQLSEFINFIPENPDELNPDLRILDDIDISDYRNLLIVITYDGKDMVVVGGGY